MNGNDWTSWTWVGWSRFFGTIGVQVLIAWKALTTQLPINVPPQRTFNLEEIHAAEKRNKSENDQPQHPKDEK
jgi:hypothetical protein